MNRYLFVINYQNDFVDAQCPHEKVLAVLTGFQVKVIGR